ncbi:MAG TPA: helix-turn-helix domain-containing protein [Myxococcus sp.]|nr:helix-turn-helix domain-containing protein [Myxococcus sp.]
MTANAYTPEAPAAPEWLPVPDAADAAGVPVRSLYRWIERKKLSTKADGTSTLVQVSAVRAIAERRAALKNVGASAGNVGTPSSIRADNGVTPPGGVTVAQVGGTTAPVRVSPAGPDSQDAEGELTAAVFWRFEEGASPVDVVREMRLPPEKVRALFREWSELKSLTGGGPSFAERISAVEERLAQFAGPLGEQVFGLGCSVNEALSRLAVLERKLATIPIPNATDFTCPRCRKLGHVAATVACGGCRSPFTIEVGR